MKVCEVRCAGEGEWVKVQVPIKLAWRAYRLREYEDIVWRAAVRYV